MEIRELNRYDQEHKGQLNQIQVHLVNGYGKEIGHKIRFREIFLKLVFGGNWPQF